MMHGQKNIKLRYMISNFRRDLNIVCDAGEIPKRTHTIKLRYIRTRILTF
jgi:hypothetical protein